MTKIFSSFLYLIFSFLIASRGMGDTLRIGGIVDPYSRVGREQKVAIELAVQHYNSDPSLLLDSRNLNSSDSIRAISYAQELVGLGAQTIIISGRSPQVLSIAEIGKNSKIPIISLAPSILISESFLVHMSHSSISLINCFANIIKSYSWRKVIALYEDDVYRTMSDTLLLFSSALKSIGSELEYSARIQPLSSVSNTKASIQSELIQMKQQKSTIYVILRSSENLTSLLFQEAFSLGMMEKGYVWICGDDITTLLDSTLTSSYISSYMQGVIAISSHIDESTLYYKTFHTEFSQTFKNEYEKDGERFFDPGIYALHAYDAVHAIALARSESRRNNKTLIDNLIKTNFLGLSGIVRPLTDLSIHDANGINSTFRVVNVVGKSYKEIGFWMEEIGFYVEEAQVMERLIVLLWPGGTTQIPGGVRRLRVGIPANALWENFVKVEYIDNTTLISGFCIDAFEATLSRLNYTLEKDYIPYTIEVNASYHLDYNDFANLVHSQVVDIVVGDVTIISYRSENVSFTQPFLNSGLAKLVPLKRDKLGWMLTKPFAPFLWLSIFGLLIFIILVVWYMEKQERHATHDFDGPWHKQFGATLWIIGKTIFLNDEGVRNSYTKIVIVCWLLVVLIISSSYTASLSSILVTEKMKAIVNYSKVGCDGDTFVLNYLQSVLQIKRNDIVTITNRDDYPMAFKNGTITVAYLEIPYLRVFLSQYDGYTVFGKTQILGGFGFVLPKGSLMTDDMSKAILGLQEDGTLKQLETKWFNSSLSNIYTPIDNMNRDSLGVDSFWTLIVFTLGASLVAVLAFEFHKYYNRKKLERENSSSVTPVSQDEEMMSTPFEENIVIDNFKIEYLN